MTGGAAEVTRPDERAAAKGVGVPTWVEGRERSIRIRAEVVSGWRLGPRRSVPDAPAFDWHWG